MNCKLLDLIGKTPLVELKSYSTNDSKIYGKLELFNPTGSIKDRTAKFMILDAISKGLINENSTIIEPTSGNTGIALASICSALKIKCIIVMPDTMSKERIDLMKAYGANVVLSDGKYGMKGSIELANKIKNETANSIILDQFNNKANILAHYLTTGPEIDHDLECVDCIVCGVGTGGTITGIAQYFKGKNVKIIAVEPNKSAVLSGDLPGKHNIQGIGAGFIPSILDVKLIDEIIKVDESDAYNEMNYFAKNEGILVGISSGAALVAAKKLADKYKNIAVILPDTGTRYLSIELFK